LRRCLTMTRSGDGTARVVLPRQNFNQDGTLAYRYTRNGADFIGAEYLEPDTNAYFFSDLGRHTTFRPGGLQEDTVARWRWFPDGDITPPEPTISAPVTFAPRLSGEPFVPGLFMQDLYLSWFDGLFEPTAARVASLGYGMAAVAPAWHVLSTDPLRFGTNPNAPDYPDDALSAQITAFVQAGVDVLVQPQIDPMPNLQGPHSSAWWDNFFDQFAAFLVHHAQIAQASGATWFSFYPLGSHQPTPPADLDARYRALVARVRTVFSGRVGAAFVGFSPADGTKILIPDAAALTWADAFDFFVLQSAGALVPGQTATENELVTGALQILQPVRDLAVANQAPMLIMPVYASVSQSWRGTSFYQISLANAPWDGENQWDQGGTYQFNELDQARVLDAWLRASADATPVLSVLPFGYWNMDMPLEPGFSIRGKSAEKVVEIWFP